MKDLTSETCKYWLGVKPYWGECTIFGADCSARCANKFRECPLYREVTE